jgi:Fur family transcriptional regulator, zinc uptake regulator
MPAIFPAPDHDHARCSAHTITYAEVVCAERGERLTASRRQVLEALASSHKPIGAYEIMDMLAGKKGRPAPVTVYRALEFLMKQGLVHRIESRNAYIACAHNHDSDAIVAFLMCDTCGSVGEASTAAIAPFLAGIAKKAGFRHTVSVIEINGTCSHCRRG